MNTCRALWLLGAASAVAWGCGQVTSDDPDAAGGEEQTDAAEPPPDAGEGADAGENGETCFEHFHCDSGACDIGGGFCVDERNIVYVDPDAGEDAEDCGEKHQPCESVGDGQGDGALAKVGVGRDRVVLAGGSYDEQVTITSMTVMMIATNQDAVIAPEESGTAVRAELGANVILDGVDIATSSGTGISVAGGVDLVIQDAEIDIGTSTDFGTGLRCDTEEPPNRVLVRDTAIRGAGSGTTPLSRGGVLAADGCEVDIRDSDISDNRGTGAIALSGATVTIQDSRIANNGSDDGYPGVVSQGLTTELIIERSHILGNGDGDGTGEGVEARSGTLEITRSTVEDNSNTGIDASGESAVVVNNVVVGNFPGLRVSPDGGQVEHNTIVENEFRGIQCNDDTSGHSNIVWDNGTEDDDQVSGCELEDYSSIQGGGDGEGTIDTNCELDSDFRLSAGSPCIGAGDPDSEVDDDIDGTSRPQGDRHDIGAHEFAQ